MQKDRGAWVFLLLQHFVDFFQILWTQKEVKEVKAEKGGKMQKKVEKAMSQKDTK